MTQLLTIKDDTVLINKLVLSSLEGPITLPNQLELSGSVHITDKVSTQLLEVNTLCVNKIVTMTADDKHLNTSFNNGVWTSETEQELADEGLIWQYKGGSTALKYKSGKTLSANANIELDPEYAFKINNVIVLNANTLGSTVVKSNLRQVGPLNSLDVMGDATFGEFVTVNATLNRVGIGTDSPNAALSIIENNVELTLGSNEPGSAAIGTHSNHSLNIVTDNIARISISPTGDVQIGNQFTKNSVLRVFGTIFADNITSDTRLTRSSSLEFINDSNNTIYNKGILWRGTDRSHYFTLKQEPYSFVMSESLSLIKNKTYNINDIPILSETALGDSVVNSNLTKVGELSGLVVRGNIDTNTCTFKNEHEELAISSSSIIATSKLNVFINDLPVITSTDEQFTIGSPLVKPQQVKIFGNLSIGINNPDPAVSLAVSGNISFANKKFVTGSTPPVDNTYVKGDICWNDNPTEYSPVGWVCIIGGTPGEWRPFGTIGAI